MTKIFFLISILSIFATGCNRDVAERRDYSSDQNLQREEEYKQQDLHTGTLDDKVVE